MICRAHIGLGNYPFGSYTDKDYENWLAARILGTHTSALFHAIWVHYKHFE